tara:strand:+ start:51 stop:686 length:636 start_codon:yes stop_codon:yes gene_type:complete
MTLPSSGSPISINDLVGEYGSTGSARSLSHYYRGGGLVANHSNNSSVPTSGTISLSDFYGQSNTSPAPTTYNYTMTLGYITSTSSGYIASNSNNYSGPYGSLTNNPQSVAFSNGFNPTITAWFTQLTSGKGGLVTGMKFEVSGVYANSGWSHMTVDANIQSASTTQSLYRSAATFNTYGNSTLWQWSNIAFSMNTQLSGNTGTVGTVQIVQ